MCIFLILLFPNVTTSKACYIEHKPETEIEVAEVSEVMEIPTVTQPQYTYIGVFKITAYCACMQCCGKTDGITATGTQATQGRTIAVYPKQIPYETEVMFNDHVYIAEDCGGAITENRIDLYFDSHQDALEWGVQYHEVFVLIEN